jgi:hypothetical protein
LIPLRNVPSHNPVPLQKLQNKHVNLWV